MQMLEIIFKLHCTRSASIPFEHKMLTKWQRMCLCSVFPVIFNLKNKKQKTKNLHFFLENISIASEKDLITLKGNQTAKTSGRVTWGD